jgi:cation diffusion facilitator CzcD-associated flavoprotein CzcO
VDGSTGAGPRIAIIGSGFSGLCLGISLQKAGFGRFTIFEKAGRVGGTWRDNTYPGAACDSPSFAYCFSFEQKTDWSRKWAPQPEILAYLDHCARKYDLLPHIRFHSEIASARFDAARSLWRLRTASGEEHEAEILISGTGQLNRPSLPEIPGLADFAGTAFHSARWDHACDLAGKDVAVIGNAASAIQFIPEIAPRVRSLRVFQRSANWMVPKNDRPFTEREKARFARHPWLARLYRWWIWLSFEIRWPVFRGNAFLSGQSQKLASGHVLSSVRDPALRATLIPDYPIGGKRILISDDYYPALQRENVEVVTDPVERITPDGVVTRDGRLRHADVLILATGFETTSFLAPMRIEGPGGQSLNEAWKEGAEAYLGISVAGFPNLFLTYGPNTNLGHNSIIFMIECQTGYIVDCLRQMRRRGLAAIDVREGAMRAFNAKLQRELAGTVWARTDHSWYKTKSGRITNNWSGSTLRYWWETRRADLSAYESVPAGTAPAAFSGQRSSSKE